MKKVLFFIAILFFAGSNLFAQKSNTSFQFNIGLSLSGLHNYPEIVDPGCDDCFYTDSYNPWIAGNAEISIFKQLTEKQEIKLGVGYDEVRFQARGYGGLFGEITQITFGARYITLGAGHRFQFFKSEKYSFHLTNAPIVNFKLKNGRNSESEYQFSWRSDLSVKRAIRDKVELIGTLFYKVRNRSGYDAYYPVRMHQAYAFNLGIEMGVARKL